MNTKHYLIAKPILCTIPAATAKTEAFAIHWSVQHPNGTPLVANTRFPMKDGAAALVAQGYAVSTDTVALALETLERFTTSEPVTIAEAMV